MPTKAEYRNQEIPNEPGVYVFRDRFSQVIYVGKAKSLRRRLASYFQPSRARTDDVKLRSLINSIAQFEIFQVRNDQEALLLESRLIKQYAPRYNILLRDDKRFLLIKIDIESPFPRLTLARLRKDDGCLYLGPFPVAGALRATVDFLSRRFGLRSCRARVPGANERRHCLDHIVRDCSAPCQDKVSSAEYHERVQQLVEVVEGNTKDLLAEIEEKMKSLADKRSFELAARMRDVSLNLQSVCQSRQRTFVHAAIPGYSGQQGVEELRDVLGLESPPRVIECFDNSNIMGRFAVASMVAFVDGVPSKKDYRHFRIRTVEGIDDYAMMREIVQRRYRRLRDEQRPFPDLVVIDGGAGQLNAAHQALLDLELPDLAVVSLAKRQEELFTTASPESIRLERHEASLKLLQAIRDEAHRFAIGFHRDLRRKRILDSLLDEIPGVGKKRKAALLKAFGSVRTLRRHPPAEIVRRLPGIGDKLAQQIADHLRRKSDGQ